ncbi:MAG TPA: methyltransferase domain-containing protein [Burkholderiales bacterium]|jgi:ubiquinone/menaquinone biosynthesis C-methylase UbiE|nr:methyltransferase domain-containing protein [Burkholderiales bacterium]
MERQDLLRARALGYACLLADAHNVPLRSRFADVIVLNATLHHCEHMAQVLHEAASGAGVANSDYAPMHLDSNC